MDVVHRRTHHFDRGRNTPKDRRILQFLGLAVDENIIEQVRTVNAVDLRHHKMTTQDLRGADVSPEILSLYDDLCT